MKNLEKKHFSNLWSQSGAIFSAKMLSGNLPTNQKSYKTDSNYQKIKHP
jgi:hypothetical protein